MQHNHDFIQQNLKHNIVVNVLDGAFFGFGFGFASLSTVIPLFFGMLTDSAFLVALAVGLHTIGWFLPQLLTANMVDRLARFKPTVLWLTIHERWPIVLLAVPALLLPVIGKEWALLIAFGLMALHSLGAGLTAGAWQNMIGKIMPANVRGKFWGVQSAAANLMLGFSAVIAGVILDRVEEPYNFALSFLLGGVGFTISWFFLAATRELEHTPKVTTAERRTVFEWRKWGAILRTDSNFRWLLLARLLTQFATIAVSFYTLYIKNTFALDLQTIGLITGTMAGIMALAQTIANPLFGWLGDRFSHRYVYGIGMLLMALSAGLALVAPDVNWFYLVFALAGMANAVVWAVAMSLTLELAPESQRPLYIGLLNTLTAPAAMAAVLLGLLVDIVSFQAMFFIATGAGLLAALIVLLLIRKQPVEETPLTLQTVSAGLD